MPRHRNAAFVLVSDTWWSTVAPLLAPSASRSEAPLVRLLGPLLNQDAAGIWLGEVPANLTQGRRGSPVMMSLLIPWDQIIAAGIIEESRELKAGFAAVPVQITQPQPEQALIRGQRFSEGGEAPGGQGATSENS